MRPELILWGSEGLIFADPELIFWGSEGLIFADPELIFSGSEGLIFADPERWRGPDGFFYHASGVDLLGV